MIKSLEERLKNLKELLIKASSQEGISDKNLAISICKFKESLEELTKGMKNGGIGGQGAVSSGAILPNIIKPKTSNNSLASKVKITGVKPVALKNPVKQAEQTQNKDIKDIKMREAQSALKVQPITKSEVIKFDNNNQWSLDKQEVNEVRSDEE